tara:strand:- start:175 stop:330 length:156 start_codon:yes stop_codon:yes gene_type:complete
MMAVEVLSIVVDVVEDQTLARTMSASAMHHLMNSVVLPGNAVLIRTPAEMM